MIMWIPQKKKFISNPDEISYIRVPNFIQKRLFFVPCLLIFHWNESWHHLWVKLGTPDVMRRDSTVLLCCVTCTESIKKKKKWNLKNANYDMLFCVCVYSSAKDKGEKKLFGFSFVPLMQEDGRTLPDGTHELIVHKVFPFSSYT